MQPVLTIRPWLAVLRLGAFGLITVLAAPVQLLLIALRSTAAERLPVWYHTQVLKLIGFRVVVTGTPTRARPALLVCNHTSYMDIMVLGSVMPLTFIAKSEVATWPGFGLLAKLQRTVFVDRRRSSTGTQRDVIAERITAGEALMLFPEGTTNDGNRVLPFKSALFAVAESGGADLPVQPISLAYTRLDGIPLGRAFRPFIAWFGDMDLGPHLWQLLGMGVITAEVHFHPPVTLTAVGGRKPLAKHCESTVAQGVEALLSGRALPAASA
ncbi:MAG: 1-acyl-sn-glycerol-3-phosphate acyltransferase [Alphaproteobacteria bacterium]|nr:lysophospholipid acyltransferase family protein [Alphaproteobacteria bacterium]TAD88660.1 MAG: 1-acyl-sn-glycerol-3-phosphate acyltransferase [Alphaproteobacteria bacterium]